MSSSSAVQIHPSANRRQVERLLAKALPTMAVSGLSVRHLRMVRDFAAARGLEVRDAAGHLLHHDLLLQIAHGEAVNGRRNTTPWTIEVMEPTIELPPGSGQVIGHWGDNPEVGRRIIYVAGATPDPTSGVLVDL